MSTDASLLLFVSTLIFLNVGQDYWVTMSGSNKFLTLIFGTAFLVAGLGVLWRFYSKSEREKLAKIKAGLELPKSIREHSNESVCLGPADETESNIYLPDSVRSRHVHVIGATGSGKTESVILNFINQDVKRGLGAIILDAKGDYSFLESLNEWIPKEKLFVFDLSDEGSLCYDPLAAGSTLESAQRLFSSLIWSEEYYKSKAFSVLQSIYQEFHNKNKRNPTIKDLLSCLQTAESYASYFTESKALEKVRISEFPEVSGLRDQLQSLSLGHLKKILSPDADSKCINLESAMSGSVIYFRLQSLLSPQAVATLGRLVINHLNYLAGTSHRKGKSETKVPVYLDEFASFACPEFADLISKARSANMMLHFSHQSIGDLAEVSKGFLNRITDNSATKIVLRINDPDSAEFFARSFGTKILRKLTHRVKTANNETADASSAEIIGEGSLREGHQFRSSPDQFKTLPTGKASVLIAHGEQTPHGASSVLTIQFPRLERKSNVCEI